VRAHSNRRLARSEPKIPREIAAAMSHCSKVLREAVSVTTAVGCKGCALSQYRAVELASAGWTSSQ
jgi:hypothetical protein